MLATHATKKGVRNNYSTFFVDGGIILMIDLEKREIKRNEISSAHWSRMIKRVQRTLVFVLSFEVKK